jgi:hypothetical protein
MLRPLTGKAELDVADMADVAKQLDAATASFLKEQDADQDVEWYRKNVVQQDAKIQFAADVASLLEHMELPSLTTDAVLLDDVLSDDGVSFLELVQEQQEKMKEDQITGTAKKPKKPTKQESANVFILDAVKAFVFHALGKPLL